MINPIFLPLYIPSATVYTGSTGAGSHEPGILDWTKAPGWAKFASVDVIGGWEWWAERPRWNWFMGWWDGDIMRKPALVHVAVFNRAVRKASLHARPEVPDGCG